MNSCLHQDELEALLNFKIHSTELNENLAGRYDLACQWNESLTGLTYLFARLIESIDVDKDQLQTYLRTFYDFPESMFFDIQEADHNFIAELVRVDRQRDLSLEEELILLQTRISNHDYSRNNRH